LAKFCALRPKWCEFAGASGNHQVCVYSIHQNAQLIAVACGIDYKDMVGTVVCDLSNKSCMVHRFSKCPGKNALIYNLQQMEVFQEYDDVVFKQ